MKSVLSALILSTVLSAECSPPVVNVQSAGFHHVTADHLGTTTSDTPSLLLQFRIDHTEILGYNFGGTVSVSLIVHYPNRSTGWLGLVPSIDSMIGKEFEAGLATLQGVS